MTKSSKKKKKNKFMEMITLPSGLKYQVIKAVSGEASQPKKGQTATVHYTGWLDENGQPGKKFDSSVDRGEKFSFPVGIGMVIKGWDEAVLAMGVGEKRRLFIPANLAYGSKGVRGVIPPDAVLIFDVELFEVK
jgi:peptidylprolyl isomerase